MVDLGPLDDPAYQPVHAPQDGRVPPVVARWGKNSQLRWFRRFGAKLKLRENEVSGFWVWSEHHRGSHCGACLNEEYEGTGVIMDGWCCCRDSRM